MQPNKNNRNKKVFLLEYYLKLFEWFGWITFLANTVFWFHPFLTSQHWLQGNRRTIILCDKRMCASSVLFWARFSEWRHVKSWRYIWRAQRRSGSPRGMAGSAPAVRTSRDRAGSLMSPASQLVWFTGLSVVHPRHPLPLHLLPDTPQLGSHSSASKMAEPTFSSTSLHSLDVFTQKRRIFFTNVDIEVSNLLQLFILTGVAYLPLWWFCGAYFGISWWMSHSGAKIFCPFCIPVSLKSPTRRS